MTQPLQWADHIVSSMPMLVSLPPRVRRTAALLLALGVTAIPLSGCASGADHGWSGFSIRDVVTPYKPELVQGNFVSNEQVQAVQKGMSRQQVRDILGSPLLVSAFHAQRWDYVFILERRGLERQFFRCTVVFDANGLFDHIEGDKMPTEAEFAARIDKPRSKARPPILEATEAQLQAFAPKSPPVTAVADSLGQPPASYPPLEPLPGR